MVGEEAVVYRVRHERLKLELGKRLVMKVKEPRQPREHVAQRERECQYPQQLPASAMHSPPHRKRAAKRDDIDKILGGKNGKKGHLFLFYPDVGVVAGSRPSGNMRGHNVCKIMPPGRQKPLMLEPPCRGVHRQPPSP